MTLSPSVTVPTVPPKTAVSAPVVFVQATFGAVLLSFQFNKVVSHVPAPPLFDWLAAGSHQTVTARLGAAAVPIKQHDNHAAHSFLDFTVNKMTDLSSAFRQTRPRSEFARFQACLGITAVEGNRPRERLPNADYSLRAGRCQTASRAATRRVRAACPGPLEISDGSEKRTRRKHVIGNTPACCGIA